MNEYSILLLSQSYRQEAIQHATARRLAREGKAAALNTQPRRRVNVVSVTLRFWVWARQIRFGWNWPRPRSLTLQNQPDC